MLDGSFLGRVSHVLCIGTPSAGLTKATFWRLFKQQVRDMEPDGPFIAKLREAWKIKLAAPTFDFAVIAGLNDQFVPPSSSLEPFDARFHEYVPGNHLDMVKPVSRDSLVVTNILRHLLPPGERAEIAAPQLAGMGRNVVDRALALELLGKEDQAIALLEENAALDLDVQGALAGRLKRRWLRNRGERREDGLRAEQLYATAFQRARAREQHEQAFYHGINAAFMTLALGGDQADAARIAREVLEHTAQAQGAKWRLATEAEAKLHLRQPAQAIALFAAARSELDPRERSSMFQQAIWTARLLEEPFVETQLEALLIAG